MDLIVSAYLDDDVATNNGALWILYLNTDGTVKGHHKITDNDINLDVQNGHYRGYGVTNIGDLDGDGVVDLAVGQTHYDGDSNNE